MVPVISPCSEEILAAALQLAQLAVEIQEGNVTAAAQHLLLLLDPTNFSQNVTVTTSNPIATTINKVPRDGPGALMYIICVMVLFAAPMIALIVRYLWGERESSRMEAFYSRIMENKPPRMILYDYNGRRLTKPELLTPNPHRKMTYHGIPYTEGYYNPSSYCIRVSSLARSDSSLTTSTRANGAGEKIPTIYLSEGKWRRWLGSISSAGTPDSPESRSSFSQGASPTSPEIYLTPSTPTSERANSLPSVNFPLKPIALWRNRSASASPETLPTLGFLSRLRNLHKESASKSYQDSEENSGIDSTSDLLTKDDINQNATENSYDNEAAELEGSYGAPGSTKFVATGKPPTESTTNKCESQQSVLPLQPETSPPHLHVSCTVPILHETSGRHLSNTSPRSTPGHEIESQGLINVNVKRTRKESHL
ncbi:sialidase-like [Hyalella azteca]|uniref:Sialidase-like n=1 Tax=Hyalella azteca TaxID=294128 RepID=A0A979FQA7_HYAAZ|nr:sialidase-like [Hyalella azteca]